MPVHRSRGVSSPRDTLDVVVAAGATVVEVAAVVGGGVVAAIEEEDGELEAVNTNGDVSTVTLSGVGWSATAMPTNTATPSSAAPPTIRPMRIRRRV